MNDERLGCMCRISVHKDNLQEKEHQKQQYDLVLKKFVKKPRHLNFYAITFAVCTNLL